LASRNSGAKEKKKIARKYKVLSGREPGSEKGGGGRRGISASWHLEIDNKVPAKTSIGKEKTQEEERLCDTENHQKTNKKVIELKQKESRVLLNSEHWVK